MQGEGEGGRKEGREPVRKRGFDTENCGGDLRGSVTISLPGGCKGESNSY